MFVIEFWFHMIYYLTKNKTGKTDKKTCFPVCKWREGFVTCDTLTGAGISRWKDQKLYVCGSNRVWFHKTDSLETLEWQAVMPLTQLQFLNGPKGLAICNLMFRTLYVWLTNWPSGSMVVMLQVWSRNICYGLISLAVVLLQLFSG